MMPSQRKLLFCWLAYCSNIHSKVYLFHLLVHYVSLFQFSVDWQCVSSLSSKHIYI
jgi:hypothetical protein